MNRSIALVRSPRNRTQKAEDRANAARTVSSNRRARFVICIDNGGDDMSLDVGKVYQALPTEKISRDHGLIRVVDNEGEDYLYSADQFVEIKLPRAAQEAVLRAR